jgi:hypothetical protein
MGSHPNNKQLVLRPVPATTVYRIAGSIPLNHGWTRMNTDGQSERMPDPRAFWSSALGDDAPPFSSILGFLLHGLCETGNSDDPAHGEVGVAGREFVLCRGIPDNQTPTAFPEIRSKQRPSPDVGLDECQREFLDLRTRWTDWTAWTWLKLV